MKIRKIIALDALVKKFEINNTWFIWCWRYITALNFLCEHQSLTLMDNKTAKNSLNFYSE